jgi:hypothetical protein
MCPRKCSVGQLMRGEHNACAIRIPANAPPFKALRGENVRKPQSVAEGRSERTASWCLRATACLYSRTCRFHAIISCLKQATTDSPEFGLDSSGSKLGPMAGSCEQGTETASFIKAVNFLIIWVTVSFSRRNLLLESLTYQLHD